MQKSEIIHYPNLSTMLEVEKVLKEADGTISKEELKRRLPRKVNHNTLKTVLGYLEESNKIVVSIRGITWIHNPNNALRKAIATGLEL